MANQTATHFFPKGNFDAELFNSEMQHKDAAGMKEQFREATAQFIVAMREKVCYLVRARTETLATLSNPHHAGGGSRRFKGDLKMRRKQHRHLDDINATVEQYRQVVRHWELMLTKFDISLEDVAAKIGIPKGSSLRSVFPELFDQP